MKKFWKRTEGFTLVELIVVIAILGILAGVGTVGYSGYIKKANMAADQQLISQMENAVLLHNYSDMFAAKAGAGVLGYVVVTEEADGEASAEAKGADPASTYMADAMAAAFGADWENALALSYGKWNATSALNSMANNDYAGSVKDSTYFTKQGTKVLLGEVQNAVGKLTNLITGKLEGTGSTIEDLVGKADEALFGNTTPGENAVTINGLMGKNGTYDQNTLANATVFALASKIASDADKQKIIGAFSNFDAGTDYLTLAYNSHTEPNEDDKFLANRNNNKEYLYDVAHTYAALEALVAHVENDSVTARFQELNTTGFSATSAIAVRQNLEEACYDILNICFEANGGDGLDEYWNYYTPGENGKSQAQLDAEAYLGIMNSVADASEDYVEDLSNANLFAEADVANTVDSYLAAASMDVFLGDSSNYPLLNEVCDGTVESAVVLVFTADANGMLSCIACPADSLA